MRIVSYVLNFIKKALSCKKRSKSIQSNQPNNVDEEINNMSNEKENEIINPIKRLIEKTKEKMIVWESCGSYKKVSFYNLLLSNFYKTYDRSDITLNDIFGFYTEKNDYFLSSIYHLNFRYFHLTICEKNMNGILVNTQQAYDYSDLGSLYKLVKDNITNQFINSI